MPESIHDPATESGQPRRVEWAAWWTRRDLPLQIVSFYIDLNVEGIYLGGGVGRVEFYLNLRLRRSRCGGE
jgi:hypothetical protein